MWFDEHQFVDPSILILPDKTVRDTLVRSIDNAAERVWIEIYTWTDKVLVDAVIRAHKRWVDVKIILEPNVYGTPTINKNVYKSLEEHDIAVSYADTYRYVFTHAKFAIIDNRYFISTWNFTQSFFTKNRDFIVSDTWDGIVSFLSSIFLRDFDHLGTKDLESIPDNLVISPIDSRDKIYALLKEAKTRIIIYTQTLQDSEILTILSQAQENNIHVEICSAKNETNSQNKNMWGFEWNTITKPYLHAKVIFIDEESVFIWSQNLTTNSLDNNREIGIIIRSNPLIFMNLIRKYREDCKK
jgi:cardiolipin synthase